MVPGIEYRQDTLTLSPGDTAIFYTDGVTEAMNNDSEELGLHRLGDLFVGSPPKNPKEANEAIFDAVRAFAGDAEQSDDVTCLTLYHSGSNSSS